MYVHFLLLQTKLKEVKYDGGAQTDPLWNRKNRKMVMSLGKLAFEQLQKGNLIFYESDLTECGLDVRAASVCSGVFTQIFREERALYQDKVFCFVHLSLQEFLAALHVHLTFLGSGVNLLTPEQTSRGSKVFLKKHKWIYFYEQAVEEALRSPHGHLDLFLRFLLGLSLQTNQTLLTGLVTPTRGSSQTNQETAELIKRRIRDRGVSPERSINLFHCLNELNDGSLVEQIQQQLRSGRLSTDKLSPAHWSALGFILAASEEDLDVFDLRKYSASEDVLLRLLPVLKASTEALLSGCQLSETSCEALSSVLCCPSSSLTRLDLSYNHLHDSAVQHLCTGLQSPHCRLQSLRLSGCGLSETSCKALSSVLSCPSSCLTLLDLSNNDLHDSGVKHLAAALQSPHCHLQSLSVSGCVVTEAGCASLASALSSNPSSHLRELDLSYNHPGDSGAQLLSSRVEDPHCQLQTLKVDHAGEQMLQPGLSKYCVPLTVDTHTVNTHLQLSDNNRKVTHMEEEQPYPDPDHPDRFDYWPQLLTDTALTGRSYWELDWEGHVSISVSYRQISRKGYADDRVFGKNPESWSLECLPGGYMVRHANSYTPIHLFDGCQRAAVFVDRDAGTVSFYSVSSFSWSPTLRHLHTFRTTFTRTPYPGLALWMPGSSVCL